MSEGSRRTAGEALGGLGLQVDLAPERGDGLYYVR
jgi:hypothetical protein